MPLRTMHGQTLASQHNPAEHVTDDTERANRQQFRSEYGRNLRPRGEQVIFFSICGLRRM